jgi:hypothetical protein
MTNILSADINSSTIPAKLQQAYKQVVANGLSMIQGYGWIAGGALRAYVEGTTPSDFDFYFSDVESINLTHKFILQLKNLDPKYITSDQTVTTISLQPNFQSKIYFDLISRDFGKSPEDSINNFDFVCCALAIDNKNKVYWHKDALEDIEKKRLTILNPSNTVSTLLRIQKYVKKGYSIDLENAKKLLDSHDKNSEFMNNEFTRLKNKQIRY